MRNNLSKVQYLLFALSMFALAGCGASGLAGNAGNTAPGSIAAKLVWSEGKSTAKTVALPAGVTSIQVTVSGTGADGKAIPVVRGTINALTNQGTIDGIYPGKVTLAVKAADDNNVVMYEGYAIGVVVNAGATTTIAAPIVMSAPLTKAQDVACVNCHETTLDTNGQNLVADFKQSGHYTNSNWTGNVKHAVTGTGCAGCHGPQHNDTNPAASGRCFECHSGNLGLSHQGASLQFSCNKCHEPHNTQIKGCIDCHSVGQNVSSLGNFVNDNNGVRAITTEFAKWSHHVTGVALNNAHCAACHLEGKVTNGIVATDPSKHMVDNKIHLRNADTDADMLWDPAAPSHSTMDNYCMGCHDANGATSPMSVLIQKFINDNGLAASGKTASASNPFGDTISNQYDLLERPAVVDAAGQFAPGNNSHHAVKGKKYSGRTRGDGTTARTVNTVAFAANSSAAMPGKRTTIYDAGKFQADYTTLADAAGEIDVAGSLNGRNGGTSLGDDSTLHCGDCHTVGQYRAADVGTRYNKAVIGAHGSNNEYLLRNNIGTDERHQGAETLVTGGNVGTGYGTKPYLVCFNCHAFNTYGTVSSNNGENGNNHAGEYTKDERCNGPFNTVFGNMTGEGRLRSTGTATTAASYGKFVGGGKMFGNMFGIQCANCHNSGVKGNIFGGIHGSKTQTYEDGMGNTSKHIRFMPGLGNAMYVPGVKGGFTGGSTKVYAAYSSNRLTGAALAYTQLPARTIRITGVDNTNGSYEYVSGGTSNDLNWEQRTQQSIAGQTDLQSKAVGCYTISPNAPNFTGTGAAPQGQQKNPKVNFLAANGYPADDVRNAASTGLTAGDGREMFDVWGGCDDHNGAQGAGTGMVRKVLRKVSY